MRNTQPEVTLSTSTDEDTLILTDMGLDLKPQCDAEGCSRDASIMIHCPICIIDRNPNGEYSCTPCYLGMLLTDSDIKFEKDKSCDHTVPIRDCTIVPL
jgi:hypothetical protein